MLYTVNGDDVDNVVYIDRCAYCGKIHAEVSQSQFPDMCDDCSKMYDTFCRHLNSINALVGAYRCRAAAGLKIPIDVDEYDRNMTRRR